MRRGQSGVRRSVPERHRTAPACSDPTASGPAVPRRLLASWQRSEDYGVPLDAVEPVFTGTDDLSSLFFQCGSEVLTDLHRTLSTSRSA